MNVVFDCRFTEDIYQMTGYRPGPYWQYTWRYIGPAIMTCILASSIICMAIDKPTYNAYKKEEVSLPSTLSRSMYQSIDYTAVPIPIDFNS